MTLTTSPINAPAALDSWAAQLGISPATVWRWRKRGMIRPLNIGGRLYISPTEQSEFLRRAEAGEFAKKATVPPPPLKRRD